MCSACSRIANITVLDENIPIMNYGIYAVCSKLCAFRSLFTDLNAYLPLLPTIKPHFHKLLAYTIWMRFSATFSLASLIAYFWRKPNVRKIAFWMQNYVHCIRGIVIQPCSTTPCYNRAHIAWHSSCKYLWIITSRPINLVSSHSPAEGGLVLFGLWF